MSQVPRVEFQPTLPVRGATKAKTLGAKYSKISTHAPRAGSDLFVRIDAAFAEIFQPTLPVRGATASTNKFETLILYHKYNFGIIP